MRRGIMSGGSGGAAVPKHNTDLAVASVGKDVIIIKDI